MLLFKGAIEILDLSTFWWLAMTRFSFCNIKLLFWLFFPSVTDASFSSPQPPHV